MHTQAMIPLMATAEVRCVFLCIGGGKCPGPELHLLVPPPLLHPQHAYTLPSRHNRVCASTVDQVTEEEVYSSAGWDKCNQ